LKNLVLKSISFVRFLLKNGGFMIPVISLVRSKEEIESDFSADIVEVQIGSMRECFEIIANSKIPTLNFNSNPSEIITDGSMEAFINAFEPSSFERDGGYCKVSARRRSYATYATCIVRGLTPLEKTYKSSPFSERLSKVIEVLQKIADSILSPSDSSSTGSPVAVLPSPSPAVSSAVGAPQARSFDLDMENFHAAMDEVGRQIENLPEVNPKQKLSCSRREWLSASSIRTFVSILTDQQLGSGLEYVESISKLWNEQTTPFQNKDSKLRGTVKLISKTLIDAATDIRTRISTL
jgi:hypothetical protein